MSKQEDTPSLSLLFLGATDTGNTGLALDILAALRTGGASVSVSHSAAQPYLGASSAPAGAGGKKPGLH
jgi:hypothetical protein